MGPRIPLVQALACLQLLACNPTDGPDTEAVDAMVPRDAPSLPCEGGAPEVTLRIDAASDRGPLRSLQGFLNGLDPSTTLLDEATVAALAPRFWRFGTGRDAVSARIGRFGAVLTFVVSDRYAELRGGYANARPFEDWPGYEAYLDELASWNVAMGHPVTYFDVWGEPQGGTPWLGTYDQLLELFTRTHARMRAIDPEARFVGPSYDAFDGMVEGHTFLDFLVDLDARGVRLDAVSWHELGGAPPESLPTRVAELRDALAAALPGSPLELHVSEYSGPGDHLIPGAAVIWLHYLTEAGVDSANRACWDVPGAGYSDCWAGLNGLLGPDGRTPQHTYFAHRYYAELVAASVAGGRHLDTLASDPRFVGLAVADTTHVRILTGRAGGALEGRTLDVGLELEGIDSISGAHDVEVEIRQIPIEGIPGPLAPPPTERCRLTITDGRAALTSQLSRWRSRIRRARTVGVRGSPPRADEPGRRRAPGSHLLRRHRHSRPQARLAPRASPDGSPALRARATRARGSPRRPGH